MTKDELRGLLLRNPQLRCEDKAFSQVPDPKLKHHQKTALDRPDARETKSLGRPVVRFVGYRIRPCDPDNYAAGCKDLLDGLRHAQLIPGDEPWNITFQTDQVKVRSRKEERTEIEIIYP